MAKGSYKKLLAWANENGHDLAVEKSPVAGGAVGWKVTVSIDDPVTFQATGAATDIDDAADLVLADLETVGAQID